MALIACPECKREVSDRSVACIHCGFPLQSPAATEDDILESKVREVVLGTLDASPTASLSDVLDTWKTISGPDLDDDEVDLVRAVYERETGANREGRQIESHSEQFDRLVAGGYLRNQKPLEPPREKANDTNTALVSQANPETGGVLLAKIARKRFWAGLPGFRSGRFWNGAIGSLGYLILGSAVLVGPLGAKLFALATLASILLATNAWGVRSRVPGFRSENRMIAVGSWTLLVAIAWVALLLSSSSGGSTTSPATAANAPTGQSAASSSESSLAASTGGAQIPAEAQAHLANARDYRDAGQGSLAMIEVDQALAIRPDFTEASEFQSGLRTSATAEVVQRQAQAEAERRADAQREATATARTRLLGTRQLPVPFGDTGTVDDKGSRFAVKVAQVERQAWSKLRAANQFNTAPPPGNDYILVALAVGYLTGPEDKPYKLSDSHEFYAGNKLWGAPFTNVAPRPAFSGENLFPGATYVGWLDGKYLPTELQEEAVLVYKSVYFALK